MQYDLIVVGGGHNGLVCAAYAAAAGLQVAVIEARDRIGGAASTEEFHPGFRNSAASYTVSLLEPQIIRELGLHAHGLSIIPRPLENFVPAIEGPGLAMPADIAELQASIARFSRHDAESYPAFAAELKAVINLLRPFTLEAPLAPTASAGEFRRMLAVARRTVGPGARALRPLLRLLRHSAGDWLDQHFETGLLKGALGFDSIVGHFASPYTRNSAYLLLHHALGEVNGREGSWGHARGGMGAISDALAAAAEARGVTIRTGSPVDRIVTDADGFIVEAGTAVYRARRVAGALHPSRLLLDLLADVELPPEVIRRLRDYRSESASFRINAALAELPDFSCQPGNEAAAHHGAGILIAPSLGYLDAAWQSAAADGISARPVIEVVIPSVIDPTLAPPGRHVASLFCQHFRYELPDGRSWDSVRDLAVQRIFAEVDRYAPNFSRSVIACKASSPLDLERRFGLVGGDIFHGAMVPGQLYHRRPLSRFARYRMPVPGLYLCAAGAHPGGGVSGAPGRNAAAAIIEDAGNAAGLAEAHAEPIRRQ